MSNGRIYNFYKFYFVRSVDYDVFRDVDGFR